MPELKFIEGIVQRVKDNKKAISLLGNWYNSFTVIENINAGDLVKLTYTIKGDFNNLKKIEVIEKAKPIVKEIKEESTKEMTNQTLNTIILSAKDIQIAWINNAKDNVNIIPKFKDIVSEIKNSI